MLTAGLIACATFLLVAVAAARKDPSVGRADGWTAGDGGYLLVAEAAAPLPFDPSTPNRAGKELGLTGPAVQGGERP